jgi:Protein kinase domain
VARDTLMPGEVVAERYVVEAHMARGGMATVYRVRHVSTGATGALKLLLADALVEPALRQKFVQEARVGARIESEHVVRVTDAGVEADGTPWLVMELLDGETLDAYLARRGPLDRAEALALLRQVAHGLGAAHHASVVHRDLKPANVFIARARRADVQATVKLLDFGIASVLSAARTGASTAYVGSFTVGRPTFVTQPMIPLLRAASPSKKMRPTPGVKRTCQENTRRGPTGGVKVCCCSYLPNVVPLSGVHLVGSDPGPIDAPSHASKNFWRSTRRLTTPSSAMSPPKNSVSCPRTSLQNSSAGNNSARRSQRSWPSRTLKRSSSRSNGSCASMCAPTLACRTTAFRRVTFASSSASSTST